MALPTRRPFDTTDQLDERMRRADSAFAMAYELGTKLVLVRAGVVPPQEDEARLEIFTNTLRELGRRAEHHGVKLALETGADPGEKLKAFLDALASPGLAASIDPGSILQAGIDPIKTVRELATWVVHAYANDATGSPRIQAVNPRGFGFPPVRFDWEEYLGSLEEVGYRGFLTVWPMPGRPAAAQFQAVYDRLKQLVTKPARLPERSGTVPTRRLRQRRVDHDIGGDPGRTRVRVPLAVDAGVPFEGTADVEFRVDDRPVVVELDSLELGKTSLAARRRGVLDVLEVEADLGR